MHLRILDERLSIICQVIKRIVRPVYMNVIAGNPFDNVIIVQQTLLIRFSY